VSLVKSSAFTGLPLFAGDYRSGDRDSSKRKNQSHW